jgi:hypothetical protein
MSSVASSQPFSKGEGLKKENIYVSAFKILSFGEDLGEAIDKTLISNSLINNH